MQLDVSLQFDPYVNDTKITPFVFCTDHTRACLEQLSSINTYV